jgi:hypothetical protein
MQPDSATSHLQRARTGIRQALEEWNAADLQKVDGSRELLSMAIVDLRAFESAVRSGDVTPSAELQATVLQVKDEVVKATRVVDACVAFHRGLAARIGGAAPGYNAEGRMTDECSGLEPEVHA